MTSVKLLKNEIKDPLAQENFQKLDDYLQNEPFRKGSFKFMELALAQVTATLGYPAYVSVEHGLNFIPKDILTLSLFPSVDPVTSSYTSVNWDYSAFTRTHLFATIPTAVTVRAYVGRYGERA